MAFGQERLDDTAVLGRCPRLRWEQAFGQARTDYQIRDFEDPEHPDVMASTKFQLLSCDAYRI